MKGFIDGSQAYDCADKTSGGLYSITGPTFSLTVLARK